MTPGTGIMLYCIFCVLCAATGMPWYAYALGFAGLYFGADWSKT